MRAQPLVLIADDHAIFAEGLQLLLSANYEVLDPVADGRRLIEVALETEPDLLLVDVSMPMLNGIDAVRQLSGELPKSKFLMLTMHPDLSYALAALEAGASGYVLKHAGSRELITAVEAILAGERFISPRLRSEVEGAMADLESGRRRKVRMKLSMRQREVLQLVAEGKTAKEIGEQLHISRRTVEFHKMELRRLLQAKSTAELVRAAVQNQLVTDLPGPT